MPINHKLCLQYLKIGNCEQLKQDMLAALIDSIFLTEPLPSQQTDFEQRFAQGKQRLLPTAYEYASQLANVLEKYNRLNQQLQKLNNRSTALLQAKIFHFFTASFLFNKGGGLASRSYQSQL